MEAGRCATPVSQGGEVRVTVGVSTGTMAAAGLVQNGANQNPISTVEQEDPANRNSFTPAPTGYSGYSDDCNLFRFRHWKILNIRGYGIKYINSMPPCYWVGIDDKQNSKSNDSFNHLNFQILRLA